MMYGEMMKYFGLVKDLSQADYFETEAYKSTLNSIKIAIQSGGIIALTGIVGTGKTVTLRRIQKSLRAENKVLVSKSLATEKSRVTINTLYTALFADLSTKKDGKMPTQAEKRERRLQLLIKDLNKPVVLFIDEAHDLHARTLVGLKHLVETVQDSNGVLAIVIVGHPKLSNDLRNPNMEEVGARSKIFELDPLQANSPKFIEWILNNCSKEKIGPQDIIVPEAITLLSERLITPLQITSYLTRALEKAHLAGEKPISVEMINSVLSPEINALEPNLARHGYNMTVLCDYLNVRRSDVKAYLRGQLPPGRMDDFNKQIQKLGVIV